MGVLRRDVPIPVVKDHFIRVPPAIALVSDFCAIGICNGMTLFIEERIGEISIIDPANVQLGGLAIALKDRIQAESRIFTGVELRVVSSILVQDVVAGPIEGFMQ